MKKRGGHGVKPLEQGLNVKQALHEAGITYQEAAEAAGICKTSLTYLVTRDIWPGNVEKEQIVEGIEKLLREKGIVNRKLAKLWDWPASLPNEIRQELEHGNGVKKESGAVRMIDLACMNHFGLKENPFPKRLRKADEMFWSPMFKRAFDTVVKAIYDREFIAVVGESGSGKTTLRMMVEQQLTSDPRVRFVAPLDIERERMRPHAIAEAIIRDLDPGRRVMPQSRENKYRLAKQTLAAHTQQGVCVALMIEEGHALTDEGLKSLKRIMEFGSGFESIIAIVLWAQQELLYDKFSYSRPNLREVALRCVAVPLGGVHKEFGKYLAWKLALAGSSFETVFTDDALRAMKKRLEPSKLAPNIDTPLQIHALASNAMMKAMETAEPKVTAEVVNSLDRWWFTG